MVVGQGIEVDGGEDLGLGGRQGCLAGKQVLGEAGDAGPEGAGEGEVGAEVEQSLLAHLAVLADGADEAVAVAGLAADEMGSGGPDEHEDQGGRVEGAEASQSSPSARCLALHRPPKSRNAQSRNKSRT